VAASSRSRLAGLELAVEEPHHEPGPPRAVHDADARGKAGCLFADRKLALAITPYFFNLIDRNDPDCPIRRQVIPRGEEMVVSEEEMLDSLGEDAHSPVPGLVHRYPTVCCFFVTDRCASYCRYCTRSRLVSNAQDYNFHPEHERALRYIEAHPEVRDVLISGGDPCCCPTASSIIFWAGFVRSSTLSLFASDPASRFFCPSGSRRSCANCSRSTVRSG